MTSGMLQRALAQARTARWMVLRTLSQGRTLRTPVVTSILPIHPQHCTRLLPLAVILQHPLLRKLNMLAPKEKCQELQHVPQGLQGMRWCIQSWESTHWSPTQTTLYHVREGDILVFWWRGFRLDFCQAMGHSEVTYIQAELWLWSSSDTFSLSLSFFLS